MEMFNVHRRDVFNFDNYMDLKKPGFGGPNSAVAFKDKSGKRVVDNPKLKEFQRVVERDPMFGSKHYDSTYKAMTHDVIYKQEKKKPVDYRDPYLTGLPVVDVSKIEEGLSYTSFEQFLSEQMDNAEDDMMGADDSMDMPSTEHDMPMHDEDLEQEDDDLEHEKEDDDYYSEEEPPHSETEPTGKDIDDIERMLKSFETGDTEEFED